MTSSNGKVLVTCGHLFSWAGGPVKTIGGFRDALDATVYSFVEASLLRKEKLALEGAIPVRSIPVPILEKLYIPSRTSEYALLNAEAEQASLISCHSFYRYQIYWTLQAKRRLGVPYWHVPHGILDPYVLEYGKIGKHIFLQTVGRSFLEDAACTVFATKREWEKAESVFGTLNGEVVHWPVDLASLTEKQSRRAVIRQKLGIPEDARVLLYFGRVQAMKRPLETIEAVASMKSDRLHLIMVGPSEGISAKDLHKRAEEVGLSHFHYVGAVFGEGKYDYLFAADAYVSFSIRENFNHTAAESLATGLPVILSKGNDLGPEVVEADAGWYLNEDSNLAFKASLEEFMSKNDSEMEALGLAGRRLVQQAFSFSGFKQRLTTLAKKYGRI